MIMIIIISSSSSLFQIAWSVKQNIKNTETDITNYRHQTVSKHFKNHATQEQH